MDEKEVMRLAMSIAGRARTEAKLKAAKDNMEKAHAAPMTEERRANLRAVQRARRQRERAEMGLPPLEADAQRRPPGRPRTKPQPDPDAPKRGPGRPKKETQGDLDL